MSEGTFIFSKEEIKENRKRWIAALLEPGRPQGRGLLWSFVQDLDGGIVGKHEVVEAQHHDVGQCCLGVASELSGEVPELRKLPEGTQWYRDDEGMLAPILRSLHPDVQPVAVSYQAMYGGKSAYLSSYGQAWLGVVNDNPSIEFLGERVTLSSLNDYGATFAEIAEIISQQPEDWDGQGPLNEVDAQSTVEAVLNQMRGEK